MHKRQVWLGAVIGIMWVLSACNPLYMPSFDQKINQNSLDDPFAEVGAVRRFDLSGDTNTMLLAGVLRTMLDDFTTADSNAILLAFDFSQSVFPLSVYTNYMPFITGDLSAYWNEINGQTNNIATWEFSPLQSGFSNSLSCSPYHPDIYYVKLKLKQVLALNDSQSFAFKIGNYLDTEAGKKAVDDVWTLGDGSWWWTVALQDYGPVNYYVTVTNVTNIVKQHGFVMKSSFDSSYYVLPTGYYYTPDRKGWGIKVNNSTVDWGVQSKGLPLIPAGTTMRIIWEGVPDQPPAWSVWPTNVVVSGNRTFLNVTNGGVVWEPSYGRDVTVDLTEHKAVVDIPLTEAIDPGFAFRLASKNGWAYGNENSLHQVLLPEPVNGWITIVVPAQLE